MVFWLAVLVGGLFAWYAVRSGFLASWIMFFNLLVAAYMAVYVTPYLVDSVSATTGGFVGPGLGRALALISIAVATFLVLYGLGYAAISGRFQLEFPGMLDTVGSGVLGFLGGFLITGVLAIALALTPWSQAGPLQSLGLDKVDTATTSYVCWWCRRVHDFIGRSDDDATNLVQDLWKNAHVDLEAPPAPVIAQSPPAAPVPPPKVVEPPKVVKGPQKPLPGGNPTLDEQLASGRAFVTTPDEIKTAVADKNIHIIEVANACTADKFDAAQGKLLQDWVNNGGVLWATNDVLTLFGVPHSKPLEGDGELNSLVSGSVKAAEILKDCKKVAVKDAADRVYVLNLGKDNDSIVPLLKLETDVSADLKAGTTDWSMIPYGKGWISDPKPIDASQYDSERFWLNFCLFCLRQASITPVVPKRRLVSFMGHIEGPLFGVWTSPGGETVFIDDRQTEINLRLTSSPILEKLYGTLRHGGPSNIHNKYKGIVTLKYKGNPTEYQVQAAVQPRGLDKDSPETVRLALIKCPAYDKHGILRFGTLTIDLNHAADDPTRMLPAVTTPPSGLGLPGSLFHKRK